MGSPLSRTARLFVLQSKIAGWLKSGNAENPAPLPSVIDPRVIQGLRQLPLTDGKDLVSDLFQVFLVSTVKRFEAMKTALASNDREALRRNAHSLRSSTANLGAHEMSGLAAEIEYIPEERLSEVAGLIGGLEALFVKAKRELESFARSSPATDLPKKQPEGERSGPLGKILLVEDSADDQLKIQRSLEDRFDVTTAESPREALDLAARNVFDLVLLDVVLPGGNGFDLYSKLQSIEQMQKVPVIFLTIQSALEDKVRAFGLGAQDYVVKPFEPLELLARIEARFGGTRAAREDLVEFHDIRLSIALQKAFLQIDGAEKELDLTPIEFKLLYHFIRNHDRVYTREQLLESVWGDKVYVLGRTIDKHVCSLRQKLDGRAQYLKTVSGQGYLFSSKP